MSAVLADTFVGGGGHRYRYDHNNDRFLCVNGDCCSAVLDPDSSSAHDSPCQHQSLGDPVVPCCGRDIADCDCDPCGAYPRMGTCSRCNGPAERGEPGKSQGRFYYCRGACYDAGTFSQTLVIDSCECPD